MLHGERGRRNVESSLSKRSIAAGKQLWITQNISRSVQSNRMARINSTQLEFQKICAINPFDTFDIDVPIAGNR